MIVRVDGSTEGNDSPADTFFPNSISEDNAEGIVLVPGENRRGVDIHQINLPSYCVDGAVEPVPEFEPMWARIERAGARNDFLLTGKQLPANRETPGRFVICGLHSGRYRILLTTSSGKGGTTKPAFSTATIRIDGGDVHDLRLKSETSFQLSAETIWNGDPSPVSSGAKVIVHVQGTQLMGGFHAVEQAVPRRTSRPLALTSEEFEVDRVTLTGGGNAYIEDVTWNGAPLPASRMVSLGAEGDSGRFRIVVAGDGASVTFHVVDKSGVPAPNANIAIIPVSAGSEAEMYSTMMFAQTDQNGVYSTHGVKPGSYHVTAIHEPVDGPKGAYYDDRAPRLFANFVARLWRARSDGRMISLAKNDDVKLTLELRPLP